ncbi:GtrA family protein [Paenibacillus dendritiformis]|uniref:GtrA family protein n=1 Tax=Paenibacillus dendritiformis C454 TaxID=1131935 RepID=H3S9M2_9BACL|nr:GtrA family protein [Paenibacillus dendritiformis C454]
MKNKNLMLLIKYGIIGLINTAVGLSTTYMLYWGVGLSHLLSTALGNFLGLLGSFVLNKKYTFKHNGNLLIIFSRFLLVCILTYILSYVVLHSILMKIKSNYIGEDYFMNLIILVESGFYTLLSFFFHKLFTFK